MGRRERRAIDSDEDFFLEDIARAVDAVFFQIDAVPDRPSLVVRMGQIGETRRHRLPGVVRHNTNFGLMDVFGVGIGFDDDSELSRRARGPRANHQLANRGRTWVLRSLGRFGPFGNEWS